MPRLPDYETVDILGLAIPRYKLHGYDGTAAFKVRKAMEVVHRPDMVVK